MKWQKYYGSCLVNRPYHGGTLLKTGANQPVSIPIDAGGSDSSFTLKGCWEALFGDEGSELGIYGDERCSWNEHGLLKCLTLTKYFCSSRLSTS